MKFKLRAGVNGGLSMFPDSTNSRSGKILQVEYPPSTAANQLQIGVTYTMWVPDDVARLRCVIVHQHGAGRTAAEKGATAAYELHWSAQIVFRADYNRSVPTGLVYVTHRIKSADRKQRRIPSTQMPVEKTRLGFRRTRCAPN